VRDPLHTWPNLPLVVARPNSDIGGGAGGGEGGGRARPQVVNRRDQRGSRNGGRGGSDDGPRLNTWSRSQSFFFAAKSVNHN
jgi:hypothetical protein